MYIGTFILLSNPFNHFNFNHHNTCLDAHHKRTCHSKAKDTDHKLY